MERGKQWKSLLANNCTVNGSRPVDNVVDLQEQLELLLQSFYARTKADIVDAGRQANFAPSSEKPVASKEKMASTETAQQLANLRQQVESLTEENYNLRVDLKGAQSELLINNHARTAAAEREASTQLQLKRLAKRMGKQMHAFRSQVLSTEEVRDQAWKSAKNAEIRLVEVQAELDIERARGVMLEAEVAALKQSSSGMVVCAEHAAHTLHRLQQQHENALQELKSRSKAEVEARLRVEQEFADFQQEAQAHLAHVVSAFSAELNALQTQVTQLESAAKRAQSSIGGTHSFIGAHTKEVQETGDYVPSWTGNRQTLHTKREIAAEPRSHLSRHVSSSSTTQQPVGSELEAAVHSRSLLSSYVSPLNNERQPVRSELLATTNSGPFLSNNMQSSNATRQPAESGHSGRNTTTQCQPAVSIKKSSSVIRQPVQSWHVAAKETALAMISEVSHDERQPVHRIVDAIAQSGVVSSSQRSRMAVERQPMHMELDALAQSKPAPVSLPNTARQHVQSKPVDGTESRWNLESHAPSLTSASASPQCHHPSPAAAAPADTETLSKRMEQDSEGQRAMQKLEAMLADIISRTSRYPIVDVAQVETGVRRSSNAPAASDDLQGISKGCLTAPLEDERDNDRLNEGNQCSLETASGVSQSADSHTQTPSMLQTTSSIIENVLVAAPSAKFPAQRENMSGHTLEGWPTATQLAGSHTQTHSNFTASEMPYEIAQTTSSLGHNVLSTTLGVGETISTHNPKNLPQSVDAQTHTESTLNSTNKQAQHTPGRQGPLPSIDQLIQTEDTSSRQPWVQVEHQVSGPTSLAAAQRMPVVQGSLPNIHPGIQTEDHSSRQPWGQLEHQVPGPTSLSAAQRMPVVQGSLPSVRQGIQTEDHSSRQAWVQVEHKVPGPTRLSAAQRMPVVQGSLPNVHQGIQTENSSSHFSWPWVKVPDCTSPATVQRMPLVHGQVPNRRQSIQTEDDSSRQSWTRLEHQMAVQTSGAATHYAPATQGAIPSTDRGTQAVVTGYPSTGAPYVHAQQQMAHQASLGAAQHLPDIQELPPSTSQGTQTGIAEGSSSQYVWVQVDQRLEQRGPGLTGRATALHVPASQEISPSISQGAQIAIAEGPSSQYAWVQVEPLGPGLMGRAAAPHVPASQEIPRSISQGTQAAIPEEPSSQYVWSKVEQRVSGLTGLAAAHMPATQELPYGRLGIQDTTQPHWLRSDKPAVGVADREAMPPEAYHVPTLRESAGKGAPLHTSRHKGQVGTAPEYRQSSSVAPPEFGGSRFLHQTSSLENRIRTLHASRRITSPSMTPSTQVYELPHPRPRPHHSARKTPRVRSRYTFGFPAFSPSSGVPGSHGQSFPSFQYMPGQGVFFPVYPPSKTPSPSSRATYGSSGSTRVRPSGYDSEPATPTSHRKAPRVLAAPVGQPALGFNPLSAKAQERAKVAARRASTGGSVAFAAYLLVDELQASSSSNSETESEDNVKTGRMR